MSESESEFVPIRGGIQVAVPRSLDLMTSYVLREQQDWFEDEIKFLRRLLWPGARVLDIGANYGVYALSLARVVGDSGWVVALEPVSATMAHLERSIAENGLRNLRTLPWALSDRDGEAELCVEDNTELSRLTGHNRPPAAGHGAPGRVEVVPVFTLDTVAQRHDLCALDFIKLDAEGEEQRIIQGGQGLLRTQSPLLMFELKHAAEINLGLCQELGGLGYGLYRLVPGLDLLAPFRAEAPLDPFQLNLFACKPDRAGSMEARGALSRGAAGPAPSSAGIWPLLSDTLPCHQSLRPVWARTLRTGSASAPGAPGYFSALDAYTSAHRPLAHGPAQRHAALQEAHALLHTAVATHPSLSRLQSLARVAWELGLRHEAVTVLEKLTGILCAGGNLRLDEPFLPVSPRFDPLPPQGDLGAFCLAAVLEQRELLRAYSSYYTGDAGVEVLRSIVRITPPALLGEEMRRRLQLIEERFSSRPGGQLGAG